MTFHRKSSDVRRLAAFVITCLTSFACSSTGGWLQAAPAKSVTDRTAVFDMDGRQILQDEANLGIMNGQLTAGINYRNVAGVAGLWSPPYVSSNFMFDARVNGEKVPTSKWTWRPFQVDREGKLGDVSVTSTTTLIYGHRAAVVSLTFENSGSNSVPLEFFTLAWLNSVQDWDFAWNYSRTETTPKADGRMLTLRQDTMAIVLAIDSPEWTWEVSGNLGHAVASLPAKQSHTVNVVITIGSADEATASVKEILANPAASIAAAKQEYVRQVENVFEKLPTFQSDNAQLERWYNRSLVHLLTNRWTLPDFVLQPYYSTGGMNGGCVANYLWNFGEPWEIFPLYDAQAARTHIKHFLTIDLLKHFNFMPITGKPSGPWYMINQEKIIGLTYYYVLLTGDTAFLDDTVDGKTIREHMVIHAMFGDDVAKPIGLIDYGDSDSHLELRRGFPYNHVSPDLNARRYANYRARQHSATLRANPNPSCASAPSCSNRC